MSYPAHVRLVRSSPAPCGGRRRRNFVPEDMLKCSFRPLNADFYCWRFKLWYNTLDCAFRTRHRTFDGCSGCNQGAFNLKSRGRDLQVLRYLAGAGS